ncbi:hypothetical protein K469DRAFT_681894 [Zopfia rhizophila CBS 207.26]|uniref:Uncharacterized protein n=1 Tax=Zopfia rhizophila CBS 207.26 TaxID=1314779 RepID=A0A6A6F0E8_9PEZI|nr:hypothetical protein K469DRAFT_681894 [Zopfia rhizophila CBS 207.26]
MGVETRSSHKKAALCLPAALRYPASVRAWNPCLSVLTTLTNTDQQNSLDTTVGVEIDPLGVDMRELVSAMNRLEKLGLPLVKCIVTSLTDTETAWQAKVPSDSLSPETDFATTNNEADLKTLIYRARLAILNPEQNLMFYVPGSIDEIVQDRSKGYLIGLVKELVAEYVKDLNALVLLVCSLKVGIQVSSTAGMVYEKGVTGRCVVK